MMWFGIMSLALLGCRGEPEPSDWEWETLTPAAPSAGTSEGPLLLPMGSPMGGYTARCGYMGAESTQDNRDSAYTNNWDESTGLQTRPQIKVLWLEAGDQPWVLVKLDVIYTFDGMVEALEDALEEELGRSMDGRVTIAASHTHASYANFSDQVHFYLGGDKYNEEIFQRLIDQTLSHALRAREELQEVTLGASWHRDWDPDDQVYFDRRPENDELAVWDDVEPGMGKDPWLHMLRIDQLDGEPLAALFTFGVHGTVLNGSSSVISSEAPGHIELGFQEQFDREIMVMHLQGGGGDTSPSGVGSGFARMESLATLAGPLLYEAWEATPTAPSELIIQSASQHIHQSLESIQVTRDGEVDWRYEPGASPDERIYDEAGEILSPLDEFQAPYGAAFCGSDEPLIPAGGIGSYIYPYDSCMDVELVSRVLLGIFDLEEEEVEMPLLASEEAGTAAVEIQGLLTSSEEGEQEEDLLIAFFPGETTSMYTEQWRRRARKELGYRQSLVVGYAQDHEGYLMIPEDWLAGGYEANINLWGPLQGEHLIEGVLRYSGELLGDEQVQEFIFTEPVPVTEYPQRELTPHFPDTTPSAGSLLEELPDYLWLPLDGTRDLEEGQEGALDLSQPSSLRRDQDTLQIAWLGGDPAVDNPRVVLEHLGEEGWTPVLTPSGREVTEAMPDILLAHTPDPLYPADAEQQHIWWASWQASAPVGSAQSLPTGSYRLRVSGERYVSGEQWPWETAEYSLESTSVELLPSELSLELAADQTGLQVWLQAPQRGWRLLHMEGDPQGENPVTGLLSLRWQLEDGSEEEISVESVAAGTRGWIELSLPEGAAGVSLTDAEGNSGQLEW